MESLTNSCSINADSALLPGFICTDHFREGKVRFNLSACMSDASMSDLVGTKIPEIHGSNNYITLT